MRRLASCVLVLLLLAGCDDGGKASDPLPSWKDGETKAEILAFVQAAVTEGDDGYVAPADRIAVFDNDGTLWCEKPVYFQLLAAFDKIAKAAKADPSLTKDPVVAAIAKGDKEALAKFELMEVVGAILPFHADLDAEAMQAAAAKWLKSKKHPRFDRPFGELVYQPMLELLAFLRGNGFKTFIVTGGGIDFVRGISESSYGIPKDQVVGSSLVYEWDAETESVKRQAKIGSVDDKGGKPPNIALHIGRRPVICAGNSDGDLQMLQYTDRGEGPSLKILVHHDDAEREYAYDHGTEKALEQAKARNWTVASMKDDFATIFPPR